jgi:hypothetical protein
MDDIARDRVCVHPTMPALFVDIFSAEPTNKAIVRQEGETGRLPRNLAIHGNLESHPEHETESSTKGV